MRDPDQEAIDFARQRLDLTKNLNDQGYFGPLPNDVDIRTQRRSTSSNPHEIEYYQWVDNWIEDHGGVIDNTQMDADRAQQLRDKFFEDPANSGKIYFTIG